MAAASVLQNSQLLPHVFLEAYAEWSNARLFVTNILTYVHNT